MGKKTIVALNILAQVFWYIVAGTATYFVAKTWLTGISQPWRTILVCIVLIAIMVLISIITNIIRATKDPDVIAASDLRMDVRHYRQYREWYDEHERLMLQYGFDSKQANEYFVNFFKQIKNPNEWRRYQEYRYRKSKEEWSKTL